MLNIIDYAILAFFALSLLVGLYRGSVATALNLVAVGAALLVAKLCYPLVSEWIAGHETWMNYLVYFSEGSSHITTEMMEYARTDLTSLTQEQIALVISNANFTISFVLLFLFTYVVASLLVTLVNRVFNFPVLRVLDGVVGGALGLARAFLLLMVLVTMIPLAVNMLQIDLITDMVEQSTLLNLFYPNNWFFDWIRSVL